jgi:hypothetical protein
MEAKDTTQASSGGAALAVVIVLALIVLPALYVASVGPAVWLIDKGYISKESAMLQAIYWPLETLVHNSRTASEVLTWYADLFRTGGSTTPVQ